MFKQFDFSDRSCQTDYSSFLSHSRSSVVRSCSRVVLSAAATTAAANDGPQKPSYRWHLKFKGLVMNLPGLCYAFSIFGWAIVFYPLLLLAWLGSMAFDSGRRRIVDWVVHIWAKICMLSVTYRPQVRGLENLPRKGQAAMYVPNHCSYMDILTLSGFVPRPLKYISKVEILRIPLIGWAMRMAGHIAIRRGSSRSQLQTFKDAVASLMRGNSVVTFAEGTRSRDGRLQTFKKGPFTMAKRAGVQVVPVTITNMHVMMPFNCSMPLGVPRDAEIIIHPPIDTKDIDEEEAMRLTYAAVSSALPSWQSPQGRDQQ
ncbi:unnamed protein product [Choristocarpus tenellus]